MVLQCAEQVTNASLEQAAGQEFAKMLQSLTAEQRALIYAELGDAAARVREVIEEVKM